MLNPIQRPDLEAGVRLMRQEYRAALLEIEADPAHTENERLRLRKELHDEYMLRRVQERHVINSHVAEDAQVASWQDLFAQAEDRELINRQEGHLRKLLGAPLPHKAPQEIRELGVEDRKRAKEGLVELMSRSGEMTYKHIDDLTSQDRMAKVRADGRRIMWIADRISKRLS